MLSASPPLAWLGMLIGTSIGAPIGFSVDVDCLDADWAGTGSVAPPVSS